MYGRTNFICDTSQGNPKRRHFWSCNKTIISEFEIWFWEGKIETFHHLSLIFLFIFRTMSSWNRQFKQWKNWLNLPKFNYYESITDSASEISCEKCWRFIFQFYRIFSFQHSHNLLIKSKCLVNKNWPDQKLDFRFSRSTIDM